MWKVTRSELKFIKIFMFFILGIFALTPVTKSNLIHRLYILLWCFEIVAVSYTAYIFDIVDDADSLNSLVGTIVFIAIVGGHFAILIDSWLMHVYRQPLFSKFQQLRKNLKDSFQTIFSERKSFKRLMRLITLFGCLIACGHAIIIWTTFKTRSAATLLYFYSLPSFLAIQFKTMEFIMILVPLNYNITVMRKSINEMGERNLKRVFKENVESKPQKGTLIKVMPQNQERDDEKQVEVLKSCYSEIYATFRLLNDAYGWSLLSLTTVYFVCFVCNTYWILLSIISQVSIDYYALLQNACFALFAFILLSLICWLCEEAKCGSRYIGCLISKLVKPLGNKRYNDLVAEFSVQTLHQRFVITAKEFFSLNLGLLGSMVAAIVTYLVILIQFMFTEKNNNESKLSKITTMSPVTDSTTVMNVNFSSSIKEIFLTSMMTSTTSSIGIANTVAANFATQITAGNLTLSNEEAFSTFDAEEFNET